ncbi:MAG: hypothetical protein LC708_02915, partial [Actinobacteria bacterium]|nr:hypothetical protein [Actinomycetota bacterium]
MVVAGAGASSKLSVARYNPNGTLDTLFSGDGKNSYYNVVVASSAGGTGDIGVEVQPDGKPVVGGEFKGGDGTADFGVARLTVGGALDPTFSGDGVVKTDYTNPGSNQRGTDVALDTSGNIFVVGGVDFNAKWLVHRYSGELAASACPGMTITNTMVGTSGNDTLTGTSGNDFIMGHGGDDAIDGGGGDDCIYAGTGDDVAVGGTGDDRLWGDGGGDTLAGGVGVDKLIGGLGDDTLAIAAGDVPASATEILKGNTHVVGDVLELGAGLDNTHVSGSPPTFTVTDPSTGGTY